MSNEDKLMRMKQKLALLQTGYTTVACSFNTDLEQDVLDLRINKLYTYKTNLDLQVNDLVVTPAFKVVRVVEVHAEPEIDFEANFDYAWIVCKIDTTAYDKIMEGEGIALKQLAKAEKKVVHDKAREDLKAICGDEVPMLDYSKGEI